MTAALTNTVHQGSHDLVTRQLDIENWFAAVYLLFRHVDAVGIGVALQFTDVLNQTSLEVAVQDFLFMVNEGFHTFVLEFANHAGTHVDYFLVHIGDVLALDSAPGYAVALLHRRIPTADSPSLRKTGS